MHTHAMPDYSSLLDFLRHWALASGLAVDHLKLTYQQQTVVSLPLPPPGAAAAGDGSQTRDEPFVPTELQNAIMDALAGKGLRTDALAARCDVDRRQLYRSGGIKELEGRGCVAHHKRIGYYRPDDPPPELPTST